jgi:hypothetical protein
MEEGGLGQVSKSTASRICRESRARCNAPLYWAYLLKEHLRMVFHVAYDEAIGSLERWLQRARRCRIGPFVALARTYYRADIDATLPHGVNNGHVESLNTKVRLIARRAFGFHSAQALIALSELTLGGLARRCPADKPGEWTHGYARRPKNRL